MTVKQGLDLASKVIADIEASGMIDATGNLIKPTIAQAIALVTQINNSIVAAGITEPAQVASVINILATVATLVPSL